MAGSTKQSRGRKRRLDCFVACAPRNDGTKYHPNHHLKLIPAAGTLPAKSDCAGLSMRTFENITVEIKGTVGVITLNRPKMLNALSFGVFREIAAAVDDLEADDNIGCILLTGRMMDAAEAHPSGIGSRVVPADKLLEEALAAAEKIAAMSRPAAAMAKEAINRAFETPLSDGLNVERNLFHATFALEDRSEGMAAFIEKRKPANKNR